MYKGVGGLMAVVTLLNEISRMSIFRGLFCKRVLISCEIRKCYDLEYLLNIERVRKRI